MLDSAWGEVGAVSDQDEDDDDDDDGIISNIWYLPCARHCSGCLAHVK